MVHKVLIGSQSSHSGSLFRSIQAVVKNRGNVVQIFLRNMCATSAKGKREISVAEQKKIKEYIKKYKLYVFVHASYLINFCKIPVGLTRIRWAYELLAEDMEMAEKMNLNGVVIHMCSRKAVDEKWRSFTMTENETQRKMVRHIVYFLKNYGNKFPHVKLLLENTALANKKIGGTMRSLGAVAQPLIRKYGTRIGICIDTCHAFAAGYPLHTVSGMKQLIAEFKKYIGPISYLALIHLNDSLDPLGSNKDHHTEIGKGYIFRDEKGKAALKFLVDFAVKNKIPMCLETDIGSHKKEIQLIKKIASGAQEGGRAVPAIKIICMLDELHNYHKSLGNHREATQYTKAVTSLRSSGIKSITNGEELMRLPWIGKGIAAKVDEFIRTGKVALLTEFRHDPRVRAFQELTNVFSIGPKRAKELIDQGILSVKDLKTKVRSGKIKLTESQRVGLKYHDDLLKKIPRKESERVREIIEKNVKSLFGEKTCTLLAGSYHTGKKESGDIDIVVSIRSLRTKEDIQKVPVLQKLVSRLFKRRLLVDTLLGSRIPSSTQTTYIGVAKIGKTARHIDIHIVGWEELPYHMLYFGSGEKFSRQIRQWAKKEGYKLSEHGLFKGMSKIKNIKTEKDIFKRLKLRWIPPNKREKEILPL